MYPFGTDDVTRDAGGENPTVRTISREVGTPSKGETLTPQRPHAEPLPSVKRCRVKIWSTPHGDMGTHVNKVAVPEGAAGSPPF